MFSALPSEMTSKSALALCVTLFYGCLLSLNVAFSVSGFAQLAIGSSNTEHFDSIRKDKLIPFLSHGFLA